MSVFSIDSQNNIALHADSPTSADGVQSFASEKELGKLGAEWPGSRFAEIWNSFAGIAPFGELRQVKKFTNRKTAVKRIWDAIQRLVPDDAETPETGGTGERPTKSRGGSKTKASQPERSNKKADVIAMMKRGKGVTLAEIVEATGWQKHTVRGFVSILGSKGGVQIESTKSASGDRTYHIAK